MAAPQRAQARPVLQTKTISNQSDTSVVSGKSYFAGVIITSGAAATAVIMRNGTLVTDPLVVTFKVDLINTTRTFMMPDPVVFSAGIYADVDANTAEIVVLYY